MELTQHRDPDRRLRAQLKRQIHTGRLLMLVVLGISILNQLMLLFHIRYHFWFSAATPYYLVWTASGIGRLVPLAVIGSLLIFGLYGVCWYLSSRLSLWLLVGFGAYCLDTLLLVIFAFTMLENPASCLFEIVAHVPVLWVLSQSVIAADKLQSLPRVRRGPGMNRAEEEAAAQEIG